MARGDFWPSSSHYYWRPKTYAIIKNFAHTRKKDLTSVAFALKMAHGTPFAIVVALLLARPRQNFAVKPD